MNKNFNLPRTALALILLTTLALGAPIAKFTASPTQGEAPLEVKFNASKTESGNETIQGYYWDYQQNGYRDERGILTSHTYYFPGEYTAVLEVVDNQGEKGLSTTEITVEKPSQGLALQPSVKDNGEGYLYIEALAGWYYNGTFTCENTTVKAEVKGVTHKLNEPKKGYCRFSKEIKTGPGTFEVDLTGEYPNGTKTKSIEANVKGKRPRLEIYAPKKDTTKIQGTEVFIEAQATQYRTYLTGKSTATIGNRSIELDQTEAGTYSGKMDVGKSGNKTIGIEFQNQDWNLKRNRSIEVINSTSEKAEELKPTLNILYPPSYIKIDKNQSLIFEIELLDPSDRPISDQEINYTLEGPDNYTRTGKITQGDYLYTKILNFTNPGKYKFTATWGNQEETANITAGPEEEIPEEQKVQMDLITPRSTVYSLGNELIIQAVVTKHGEFIEDANVSYVLDDNEEKPINPIQREGEYKASMGTPEKGRHEATAIVEYKKDEGRKTVPFKVSDKYLNVDIVHPPSNETLNLTEGDRINLKANVTDQNNVIAKNAIVTAQITSPMGKESEMKMKPEGDLYRVSYYPEETGQLNVKVEAQKSDHVAGETKETLSLIVNEKRTEAEKAVGNLSIQVLLKIALALAIIILLLTLVTRIL